MKKNVSIDIKDNAVDLILCMDVLEHCDNLSFILKDLNRVLLNDGIIIINLPFLYREHEMPYDYARYTSSAIQEIMTDAGYREITIKKYGNLYFTLYSLWNESVIKYGENYQDNLPGKLLRKSFNWILLPLMNLTLFRIPLSIDDGIFHHLFITARK